MTRPLCPDCEQRFRAISYHKYDRVYYRSRCGQCLKKSKRLKSPTPRWQLSGYKKKMLCDLCGFRARWPAQTIVYYIDGNLNHNEIKNLRTVCKNCQVNLAKTDSPWKNGDLAPDY